MCLVIAGNLEAARSPPMCKYHTERSLSPPPHSLALGLSPPPGLHTQLTLAPEVSSARVLLGSLSRVYHPHHAPPPLLSSYPSPSQMSPKGLDEKLALSWPTYLLQRLQIRARQRIEGEPLGPG